MSGFMFLGGRDLGGGAAAGGPPLGGASGIGAAGGFLSIAGAVMDAVGSYFEAQNVKSRQRSQALSEEFQGSLANLNARQAEQDAAAAIQAKNQEIGLSGLRYGQEKGAQRAELAAGGVDLGTGSAAEVLASTELAKQIDAMTINSRGLREANAARARQVDQQNQADIANLNARNARRSAGSVKPWLSAMTSLLGSSGSIGRGYANTYRAPY